METLQMLAFSGNSNSDVHASGQEDQSDDDNRARYNHWDIEESEEF